MSKVIFLRVGPVFAVLYLPTEKVKLGVIYCRGGPCFGDDGNTALFKQLCDQYKTAILVPDYLGSNRSLGTEFSMSNIVKTINIAEKYLSGMTTGIDLGNKQPLILKLQKIGLVGSSFGGALACNYFTAYPSTLIKKLGLIAAETDWSLDKDKEGLLYELSVIWKGTFRRIDKANWKTIIFGKSKYWNPVDNVSNLKEIQVLIAHGAADNIVDVIQSNNYFNKLKEIGNLGSKIRIYKNVGHGEKIKNKGMNYFFKNWNHDI